MAWLIGIDEAGYGPNLGPLVVGATAWWVDEGRSPALATSATTVAPPLDLYQRLSTIVSPTPDGKRIAIADSKQLYKPASHAKKQGGLAQLERGVLSALAAVGGDATARWSELLETTQADPGQLRHALPWHVDFDCPVPIDVDSAEIENLANQFVAGCAAVGVRLVDVRARLVFPAEFNELTEHYGTKGAALSHVSMGLLRGVLEGLKESGGGGSTWPSAPTGGVIVTCDKHGGRNRYGALLQHHFPDEWIQTHLESRAASRYSWGEVEICFRTKGEAELPVALASMTAKYQREIAMRAFNAFWREKLPKLRPTAGYPVDAKRFKAEIASLQSKLAIDDAILWRNR